MSRWPSCRDELVSVQEQLGTVKPRPWCPGRGVTQIGGCFACFGRGHSGGGVAGEPGWAGAALLARGRVLALSVVTGQSGWRYEPGLLALREGPLLEAAVLSLSQRPEALLVNATGRDHPRRAGLAVHLGAVLDLPTVGVTHRPLYAGGAWPESTRGAMQPLLLADEVVGFWVCTKTGTRPLAVHAGWRTDAVTAAEVVLRAVRRARTPEPLRRARRAARLARAGATPAASEVETPGLG